MRKKVYLLACILLCVLLLILCIGKLRNKNKNTVDYGFTQKDAIVLEKEFYKLFDNNPIDKILLRENDGAEIRITQASEYYQAWNAEIDNTIKILQQHLTEEDYALLISSHEAWCLYMKERLALEQNIYYIGSEYGVTDANTYPRVMECAATEIREYAKEIKALEYSLTGTINFIYQWEYTDTVEDDGYIYSLDCEVAFSLYNRFSGDSKLMVTEVKKYNSGILYELQVDCQEFLTEQDSYASDRFWLGYFFLTNQKIYCIKDARALEAETEKELLEMGKVVCQAESKEDSQEEKGWHEFIVVENGICKYHSWNDLTETGYYESFIWEAEKGLIEYRSGYGAGRDEIVIKVR